MQELHVKVADGFAVPVQAQALVAGEGADVRGFHVLGFEKLKRFLHAQLRHGHNHAFLRFADPGFQIAEPFVLQGHPREFNFGAEFFAHLADGAG